GLPAAETFPRFDLAPPPEVLQYGATEGDAALRAQIAAEMQALGLDCGAEQVLILSGSQQGIDLVGKLFIDPGTPVAVESPTYLAALQVFRFFGARFQSFHARQPETLAQGERPAVAYVIPTFQNPTGHCYSSEERAALAHIADASGIVLFEDDPYRDLVYDACDRTPICAQLKHTSWIYQGSFSKSLAPGLRLGFMIASPALVPLLARLKQAADLHSNRLSQWLVLQQLQDPGRRKRLTALVETYRNKRDAFADSLARHFSDQAEWEIPKGGLFFWLRLRQAIDTQALLQRALAANIAFMPGEAFYANSSAAPASLRLNFSHASASEAEQGLAGLANMLRDQLLTRL
ncbi:MAG TPA: PLP-dependent aminotransferase family protein, partial [Rhodocyclaceae bacterium]|nr:PLP-dependent aminotransferase family protein [Rhodocyclaceae bacterium]